MKIKFTLISIVLTVALVLSSAGCDANKNADLTPVPQQDLMVGITAQNREIADNTKDKNSAVTDFAVRLFKAGNQKGENTLISPLSIISALAMTVNGADNETLGQMETVLGIKRDELNNYLYNYMKNLSNGEKYKISLANSVWFTDDKRFTVNKDFLQTNADYYGADIFRVPFDNAACNNINSWVKEKTDGMIPEILKEIPSNAVMYLVNALAFEAEWSRVYEKYDLREGEFKLETGEKQKAEFMYSNEGTYLEDQNAKGFMKYYSGNKYAFVALLPNEGISVEQYIESLSGEALNNLLKNPRYESVYAAIPKFETEYDSEMSKVLKNMGMNDAFDEGLADFNKLGTSTDGNIFIGKVIHKTFISVGEKGTKAGAATVIEMDDEGMAAIPKELYLNRPFIYMLIDCENKIPFFIGTLMSMN